MTTSTRSPMPGGGDHPPAFLDVRSEARCVFEHLSEVQLRELPIDHALEDVRRELELPNPPGRPPHPGLVLAPEKTGQNVGCQTGRGLLRYPVSATAAEKPLPD